MSEFLHDREQWIMRYLDNELSQAELDQFNEKIKRDPTLKEEVEQKNWLLRRSNFMEHGKK